jgi:hypothetical protein
MKLEEMAIDELHQTCCAEFEAVENWQALATLNSTYDDLRQQYISTYRMLSDQLGPAA